MRLDELRRALDDLFSIPRWQSDPAMSRWLPHVYQDLGYDYTRILAARSPIHPNPIGLTLVDLVKREGHVLWVRGLDAYDGTPVLDIKPYPDWEHGRLLVVTDFRIPEWLTELLATHD